MTPDPAIPLSFAHLSELDTPPLALVDLAAAAGIASLVLRMHPAAPGGIAYPLRDTAEQTALRARLAATGVNVQYAEMISLARDTDPADSLPVLRAGAAIGATRLAVAGNDADFSIVADRMSAICDLAAPFGIAVDIEFMPFRAVRSLADALDVVRRANRPNAHVMVDALHFFRSNSDLRHLAAADPAAIGTFQLCDAPATPPPADALATEARTARLLPGAGGLPLWALIDALPARVPFGIELPIAGQYPTLSPGDRMKLMVATTRKFLSDPRHP